LRAIARKRAPTWLTKKSVSSNYASHRGGVFLCPSHADNS
jgi:predicted outer membrane repeat protein